MVEDVLEQLVDDYFLSRSGFFTKHNIKFRPLDSGPDYIAQMDSVHSDIDVIAINTSEPNVAYAASCKSWHGGFNITEYMDGILRAIGEQPAKTKGTRDLWCTFRELCIKKWTRAFMTAIRKEMSISSKSRIKLNYWIVCTRITPGSLRAKKSFESSRELKSYFEENENTELVLKVVPVPELINELLNRIDKKATPSVEMTELSRIIQLLTYAGCKISIPEIKKEGKPLDSLKSTMDIHIADA